MIDFVTVYDEQGRVLWINRTDPALNIPENGLLGKSIFDCARPGTEDENLASFGHAMLARQSRKYIGTASYNGVTKKYLTTIHPVTIPGRAALVSHAVPLAAIHLSPREIEVAVLIASDLSTKQIAARLDLSVSTVESHRQAIHAKLGGCGIAGITIFCIKHGLVSP